jgi:hypothetical protein
MGGSFPRLSSAELYEPATGAWHSAGAISHARGNHTATLLPEGQVFVVGGGEGAALGFAEVYSPPAGSPSRRPQFTEISPSIAEPGDTLLLQGQRFRSPLEGSSGGRQSSPAVFPVLTLRSISGDRWIRLAGRSFSETSVTVDLPSLPGGYYWLHVTTQALTSSKRIFVSNRTPPETALTASPSEQTQATQASFAFSSGAVDLLTFECSLDRAGFSPCASPITYDSLSPGPHTFQVRARDIAGNVDANPATASWLVDTEAPQSTLSPQVNALTNALQASFQFSSAAPDVASFECSLDRADFTACLSPITYDSLGPGLHSFQVRARDRAGNVEPSPAAYTWTVDTEAPDADFAQGSIPPVTHTRASFAFSSSAKDLFSFECKLDDAPFTACLSPVTYDSLSPGAHTVRVRARDTAGNVTLEPTAHSWEVDTTPPAPPSIRAPAQGQQLLTPQPVFSGTAESGSTVTLFLNGAEVGTVRVEEDGAWSLPAPAPIGFGDHRVRAIATDPVGNLSEATAEVSFSLPRRGYYSLGCAAGSPAWASPWVLLLLGLLRRRSRRDVAAAPRLESSLPGPGPGQTRLPPRGVCHADTERDCG